MRQYITECGAVGFTAEQWINHYEANGWKVGKNAMKDWKAAVRTWRERHKAEQPQKQGERTRPAYDQAGNVIPGKVVRY